LGEGGISRHRIIYIGKELQKSSGPYPAQSRADCKLEEVVEPSVEHQEYRIQPR